jgi:hypothetical protein
LEEKRKKPDSDDRQTTRNSKKPYATPVLTEYGNVAKLTQSGAGSITDGTPNNSQLMSCL